MALIGINLFNLCHCTKNMVCNINLISYVSLSYVSVFEFLLNIKVVEGSGSEGALNMWGRVLHMGIFRNIIRFLHVLTY